MADIIPKSKGKKGKGKKPKHLLLWIGLAAVAGVAIYLHQKDKKKSSATATPTAQTTAGAYSTSPAVGTLASQVPQFVNQTYVNPTPGQVTQTVNVTQKPPPPPPPPHKRPPPPLKDPDDLTGGNDDKRRKPPGRFGHGPQPIDQGGLKPVAPHQAPGTGQNFRKVNPGGPIRRPVTVPPRA